MGVAAEEAAAPASEDQDGTKYMKGVRHLCEQGVAMSKVPTKYVLPLHDRPFHAVRSTSSNLIKLPIIDLQQLHDPHAKPLVLHSMASACQDYGFFQVVNHGIPGEVLRGVLGNGRSFFKQPYEERARFMSSDVRSPVRYGTSFNQMTDRVLCWRDFLKLSCHPLHSVLPYWPTNPRCFRESALAYAKQSKRLVKELVGAIVEALGLEDRSIVEEFDEGTHMMVVNYFPPCPEPEVTLGMPPHSDYGFLTLVLQDAIRGLQILCNGEWVTIEPVHGSIVVHVGDHLEIFSNGRFKSALHRVLVNSETSRMSVASLHSLPYEHVVRPSAELIDEVHPRLYMDTDFSTFLDYLASSARHEVKHKSFLQTRMLAADGSRRH